MILRTLAAARRFALAALISLAAGACNSPAPPDADSVRRFTVDAATLRAAIENTSRLPEDFERDASSKPLEVLEFLGVAPGMRVLDMNSATGYFEDLLARIVGPAGHVIAHNHPGARTSLKPEAFERRYGANRLPNVEQLFVPHNDIALPRASIDLVLMSMVYHDTYWYSSNVDWGPVDQQSLLHSLHDALAPGGIVGVIDHYATAGVDPKESAVATHRIDRAIVERDFAAAGFVLEAASDVLRNEQDDYDVSVFDAAVHGRTDRFVLRFRRAP